uniref:Myotubularin phosphatase domain-containing protein n=1 Tax=Arcella intermedia TaxID=1963864 RepID=A0A6B2L0V2_9EUKA
MSKFRLFIKTVSYGDTIKIPFMVIDQIKLSREVDILTLVCKDARTISLCRNPSIGINKSDEFSMFITKLKELVEPRSIKDSFAYDYRLAFNYPDDGWNLFDPVKYYGKLLKNYQIDGKPVWCISEVNKNYKISPTYPSCIVVPTAASDQEMLKRVSIFRSKGRIPSLCWKHPTQPITITRCSQPKIGIAFNSSTEDKHLIEAIRQSNPLSPTLYLVDARPKVSAIGNVIGPTQGGYEHDYKNTEMRFLNIDNIHAMRDSLRSLFGLLFKAFLLTYDDSKWHAELEATAWLMHLRRLLSGAVEIVELIENNHSSVLIHCSDGWDRTAQLSALCQLMIDPFLRTIEGFAILIEKEWCSFGHKFAERVGHTTEVKKKPNEKSPVFIQWLDTVFQLLSQFPTSFEFNEELLIFIADALYDCRFGTFLGNNEKERKVFKNMTVSIWSWVRLEENIVAFTNPLYDPESTEVLWPSTGARNIHLWENYWLRHDPDFRPKYYSPLIRNHMTKVLNQQGFPHEIHRRPSDSNSSPTSPISTPIATPASTPSSTPIPTPTSSLSSTPLSQSFSIDNFGMN